MPEVMLTAGLVGLSAGLFVFSSSRASKPKVDALARVIVSELSQARLLAIRQQAPVAIVFPSGDKTYATSLYQVEGLNSPRICRVANFQGDFPGLTVFIGSWTSADTRDAPIGGTKWSQFKLAEWIPPSAARDYALVFMPDGTVRSNDLPQFEGEFHIAVSDGIGPCQSVNVVGGELDQQPPCYRPETLGETRTVCINAGGSVRMESGLYGAPQLAVRGRMPSHGAAAAPRHIGEVIQAKGQPLGTSVLPPPVDATQPSTIPPDGFATLTTYAKDTRSSGQRLFCSWKVQATDSLATGDSAYSIPVDANSGAVMDFNQRADLGGGSQGQAYTSSWAWRPPWDAKPGEIFTMALLLQNEQQQLVDVAIEKKVQVLPYGHILFVSNRDGHRHLYRMNPDGTDQRRFYVAPSTPANPEHIEEYAPSACADGSRIVFISERTGVPKVVLASADGLDSKELLSPPGLICSSPCLSPAGDRVAFKGRTGPTAPWKLYTQSIAGSAQPSPLDVLDGNDLNDRICWPEPPTGSPHWVYYSTSQLIPEVGVVNKLHRVQVDNNAQVVAGTDMPWAAEGSMGAWGMSWSPQTGDTYYVADGTSGEGVGDTLVGKNDNMYIYSGGIEDRGPCGIWYYGQELVLSVRRPIGTSESEEQIYLLTPPPTLADPLAVRQLTTQGTNRSPVFLR